MWVNSSHMGGYQNWQVMICVGVSRSEFDERLVFFLRDRSPLHDRHMILELRGLSVASLVLSDEGARNVFGLFGLSDCLWQRHHLPADCAEIPVVDEVRGSV